MRARPDGYTLLLVATPEAISPSLYRKLNFNLIRDIAPVASIRRGPFVMEVNPSLPVKTVPEFIAYAKANPGKIGMASAGIGTPAHVAGELFKMMAGVNMLHVPYRGSAPSLVDLMGGVVQVTFDPVASSIGYIRAGQLPALAVTTAKRWETLPELPTVGDFVPGYEASGFTGIGAPRKLLSKSSISSTKRSIWLSPIPASKQGMPTWAVWCFRVRPPTSAISSLRIPRNGARWSSLRASNRQMFHSARPANLTTRGRLRVKMRKAHSEHFGTAVSLKADPSLRSSELRVRAKERTRYRGSALRAKRRVGRGTRHHLSSRVR